jgi:TetR/AcrR family transcriptional repressor of nem operon
MFCSEIERGGRMYLTGMLGAEAGGSPPEVVEEIETFFRRCIDLSRRIDGHDFVARASHVMAALEGGLILARSPWRHQRVRPCDPGEVVGKLQLMSWIR